MLRCRVGAARSRERVREGGGAKVDLKIDAVLLSRQPPRPLSTPPPAAAAQLALCCLALQQQKRRRADKAIFLKRILFKAVPL